MIKIAATFACDKERQEDSFLWDVLCSAGFFFCIRTVEFGIVFEEEVSEKSTELISELDEPQKLSKNHLSRSP